MKSHLARLLKGTFIYSSGQFFSRIITFFLLPLTTSYLTPWDYGVIGSLAILGQLFNGLYTLGFGVSLSRSYWSTDDIFTRHGIIWAGFAALLANAIILTTLVFLFAKYISWMALGSEYDSRLVILTFLTLGMASSLLPFASYLRAEEKAWLVVSITLLEIVTSLSMTLYLVIVEGQGAAGVIIGSLIAQTISFLLMLLICSKWLYFTFSWQFLPEMFRMGYPYMFGLLGYFLLQCSARYLLQFYEGMDEVGLFYMGSNFAGTITLAVTGFISAWPPFFTSFINKQEEAISVFGKVLTYYVIAMSALVGLFFILAKPVVHLMLQPVYYDVWTVVGILASAQALWGVYGISAAPLIFYKKSSWQVLMEIGAGTICTCLNFLLIPFFHKEGAAIATFLGFLSLTILSFWANHRLLPVQYEKSTTLKAVTALGILGATSFLPIENPLVYNAIMFLGSLAFYYFLWQHCLTHKERDRIIKSMKSNTETHPCTS